jgi:hypothetical protein
MLPACEPRPVLTRRGISIKIHILWSEWINTSCLLKEGRKENTNIGGKKERENSTRLFCELHQSFAARKIRDPIADTIIKCLKFMDRPSVKGIIAVHVSLRETMFTVWKEMVAELHGVEIRMLTVTETQLVQVFVELKCTTFLIMRN